jgi:uncharacterized protein (DUF2237 family)
MEGYRRPPAGHPFDDATRLESFSASPPGDFYRAGAGCLGPGCFGEQVLCKTNTLLLAWKLT